MFRVGLEVFVERDLGSQKIRAKTRLVGVKPGRYLIFDMPLFDGTAAFTVSGEPCIVRFVDEGQVVGFSSRVIQIHYDPTPLVFIDYPRDLEQINLRARPRLRTSIPSTVRGPGLGEELAPGVLMDLSEGGARILTSVRPGRLEPLTVSFGMPSGRSFNDLAAEVVSVNDRHQDKFEIGVRFLQSPPELVEEIKRLIQTVGPPAD
jgi:c-di-GMP-binding flagellar brake protein YcgR